ncbi:hypothetical protein BZG36_03318 [Bifiguratus adelaidae]|uniref:Small RNA 2'-O-methyltransferase n=1 Tax=Bifiguratus adelaidae TaxID=1938954 RepID=A0A261XXU2_9FUNG|nr:hypothetical protein BZG36_03318 [Bifiguratus adelaidae]
MEEAGEGQYEKRFRPPLWRQRRQLILDVLREIKVQSVIDYGCGEGNLIAFLIPEGGEFDEVPAITRLAGVDLSLDALREAHDRCQPWQGDRDMLRVYPLTVDLYHGSVLTPNAELRGYEAIVCSEVVEHIPLNELETFFPVALGFYEPKYLVITTPNAEFNVHFPNLRYGQLNQKPRNTDHKWEWTRRGFQEWCNLNAQQYGYSVEFSGVGTLYLNDLETVGHCTQVAVFRRKIPQTYTPAEHNSPSLWPQSPPTDINKSKRTFDDMDDSSDVTPPDSPIKLVPISDRPILQKSKRTFRDTDRYAALHSDKLNLPPSSHSYTLIPTLVHHLVSHAVFPYYDAPVADQPTICAAVDYISQFLSYYAVPETTNGASTSNGQPSPHSVAIKLEDLWAELQIRQICKRRHVLVQALERSPDHYLFTQGNDMFVSMRNKQPSPVPVDMNDSDISDGFEFFEENPELELACAEAEARWNMANTDVAWQGKNLL